MSSIFETCLFLGEFYWNVFFLLVGAQDHEMCVSTTLEPSSLVFEKLLRLLSHETSRTSQAYGKLRIIACVRVRVRVYAYVYRNVGSPVHSCIHTFGVSMLNLCPWLHIYLSIYLHCVVQLTSLPLGKPKMIVNINTLLSSSPQARK